jgi:hypothetical protein
MWGFDSLKDLLDVLLIPVAVGAMAVLWPELQCGNRRRRFEALIHRELEELTPFPETRSESPQSKTWTEHQTKTFIHQHVFNDVNVNRDFILALDPSLAYEVSQLWEARKAADDKQWLWYLESLAKRYNGRVAESYEKWKRLIDSYRGTDCRNRESRA